MVVNWDNPVVKEKTREIVKELAKEFEKAGKFKKVEEQWEKLNESTT